MFIRDLSKCKKFIAGDNTILKELFNPLTDDMTLRYSLAHAVVKPGEITYNHRLRASEVYYILQGKSIMYIDDETAEVKEGQIIYIPPNSKQRIKNIGNNDLIFLCIVDPAWKQEDEEILE
ncbi:MAG: cupin domain-containing protein [Candidatus Heimdallarchaeaceae archaeon]|jgi:mannose-6-phosphate isomerase-like protein (cupin superfamily)